MTHSLSRRDILRAAAVSPLWFPLAEQFLCAETSLAQTEKKSPVLPAAHRWGRMVHEWFVRQVREVERKAEARRAALKTKADAERYVANVRRRIRQSFGPFPEKTPLKPRITRILRRDAYTIENILFESRPGFLVTANLYVPRGRKFPLPGVVGTCGHSSNGKAAEAYQSFAQGLARQGYVVLIYDPIGQGERLQYTDEKLHAQIGVGVREHLHAGNQQFLVGEFFGAWRAWDGIRALDYLLSRKEVDPQRIGVTGNSGGGTMTTWLCGVEQRWSMAAPSCFVTTFRRNLENELPADTEQCPPRALALGLDHSDFIAALAPKPVILLAKEKDYFDVRGTEEAYRRLKRLYRLLGHEENIGLFIGPTYHGYSQENREAMYRWFNKATGISDAKKEPELTLEKDETLWCTPHGQVAGLKSKTVFDFTREKAKASERWRKRGSLFSKLNGKKRKLISRILLTTDPSNYIFRLKVDSDGRVIINGQTHPYPQELYATLCNLYHEVEIENVELEVAKGAPKKIVEDVKSAAIRFLSGLGLNGYGILIKDSAHPDGYFMQFAISAPQPHVPRYRLNSLISYRPTSAPPYRIIRHRGPSRNYPSKYHITYAVETEPGIHAIVYRLSEERLYSRPPKAGKRAVLYVAHQSADEELRTEPLLRELYHSEKGTAFFTVDVRGIGESRPGTAGANPYTNPYGADYFYAIHSLMLNRPYVGQKMHDLLRVLDWLRSVGHTEVHLVAKGWGTIPATFAAVLSKEVRQVTLKNAPKSFHDIATSKFYNWPLSCFVPNVLALFDLPECYAALQAKKLRQIDPLDAQGRLSE